MQESDRGAYGLLQQVGFLIDRDPGVPVGVEPFESRDPCEALQEQEGLVVVKD